MSQLATSPAVNAVSLFSGEDSPALAPIVNTGEVTTYVAFFSSKMKAVTNVAQKLGNVPEGTPLMFEVDGNIRRLDNMVFFLLPNYVQHFSILDDNSQPIKTAFGANPDPSEFKECIESVIVVFTPDGLIPARCGFRTTKTPAAKSVIDSMILASNNRAAWSAQSADHAATADAITKPWLMQTGTVTLSPRKGKRPGKDGRVRDYILAESIVKPTSAAQLEAVRGVYQDPTWQGELNDCIKAHAENVKTLEAKKV